MRTIRFSKYSPSIYYALFSGRLKPAVMDDFGNLVPILFYNLAISINAYRIDFS